MLFPLLRGGALRRRLRRVGVDGVAGRPVARVAPAAQAVGARLLDRVRHRVQGLLGERRGRGRVASGFNECSMSEGFDERAQFNK